ncbi:docking protein 1-like [Penaeus indicus]|uniref:docking protein 1-like n=1 Tax=Penaeus indicus TaxID=29960 RepID=UPI00300C766C
MESAVRCGYLYFRFTNSGKTFPKKNFVQLCRGHENGFSQLLVYEDERSSMAMSNCLCMILGQEAEEAKEWQGQAAWDYFSFKVVASDYEYVFSAASEKERDAWLEDVMKVFFWSPVDATPLQDSATRSTVEYENPYKYIRKFLVTLDATTAKLLGANGCVMLSVENFYLTVTYPDGNRLGRFDISELRRYGFTNSTFNLSTGRKSMFGEGTYTFITRQGQHIYANWKEEIRLAKLTGKPKPSPGEVEALPTSDHPLFTRPGHTYERSEDCIVNTWSSSGYTNLDSMSSSVSSSLVWLVLLRGRWVLALCHYLPLRKT